MNKKIAFVGTHSTGKTTLAKLTGEDLKLPIITNVMRNLYSEHEVKNFEKLSLKDRARFQKLALSKQILLQNDKEAYITDRSVIDMLAYTIQLKCLSDKDLGLYKEIVKIICEKYDKIFYFPIMFSQKDEQGRASSSYRKEIDTILQELFVELEIKVFKITEDGLADRLATVKFEIINPTYDNPN
jgi:nicotinamide riboside kinase